MLSEANYVVSRNLEKLFFHLNPIYQPSQTQTMLASCLSQAINSHPLIVSGEISVGEAIAKIQQQGGSYALVVDQVDHPEKIQGIFTEKEALAMIASTPDWSQKPIAQATVAIPLRYATDLPDSTAVFDLLQQFHASYLAVINAENQLLGVVSELDLFRSVARSPDIHTFPDLRLVNQELVADNAEHKRVTSALRESEERLQDIIDNAAAVIYLKDPQGRYILINRKFQILFHVNREDVLGKTNQDIFPKDLADTLWANEQKVLESEVPMEFEEDITVHRRYTYLSLKFPLHNDQGELYAICCISTDISDRKRAEEALQQSEERFRKIFEESPLGMAVVGFNQRMLQVNPMLCQILGYTDQELLNLSLDLIVHPDDIAIDQHLWKQLYYGKIPNYQIEKRYLRKDRTALWVMVNASVVRDREHKTLHSLVMVSDITKQKQSQEIITASLREKEVMLREIHHRVKNNLHVIANLLDLQSQSLQDEHIQDLFSDSQNRIYSMALIHEQLCQPHMLTSLNFQDYIQNLVDNLFMSYSFDNSRIRRRIEVEPISLNLETAIPCGLIINELVSNSLKYAFPKDVAPREAIDEIRIQFYAETINQNDSLKTPKLVLVIGDNGKGIPRDMDWQNASSLGLRLVRILARQLDGTVELDQTIGTQFRLTFSEIKYHGGLHDN